MVVQHGEVNIRSWGWGCQALGDGGYLPQEKLVHTVPAERDEGGGVSVIAIDEAL